MTEHYFTHDPVAAHDEAEFVAPLLGREFRFRTDAAVFSRDRVDFGSQLLIETAELAPGDTVLDLGCGYGPIGVAAAASVPEGQVYLVDVNQRATDLAHYNLEQNGLEQRGTVRTGDGTAPVAGITFTKVLCNPPVRAGKATVHRLMSEAHLVLAPGGSLWVVIQNKQGAPSLRAYLEHLFGNCADVARKAGYHILVATKT